MAKRRSKRKGGSGKRKDDLLQLRLEAIEKLAFEEAAEIAGLGLSAWVRARLRGAARRELEEAGRPIPFIPSLNEFLERLSDEQHP